MLLQLTIDCTDQIKNNNKMKIGRKIRPTTRYHTLELNLNMSTEETDFRFMVNIK